MSYYIETIKCVTYTSLPNPFAKVTFVCKRKSSVDSTLAGIAALLSPAAYKIVKLKTTKALYKNVYFHSFIPDIYIAPLQETYSEALSVQLRSKRNVLRSLQKEDFLIFYRGSRPMAHLSWTPQLSVHIQRNQEMKNIVT